MDAEIKGLKKLKPSTQSRKRSLHLRKNIERLKKGTQIAISKIEKEIETSLLSCHLLKSQKMSICKGKTAWSWAACKRLSGPDKRLWAWKNRRCRRRTKGVHGKNQITFQEKKKWFIMRETIYSILLLTFLKLQQDFHLKKSCHLPSFQRQIRKNLIYAFYFQAAWHGIRRRRSRSYKEWHFKGSQNHSDG